MKRLMKSTIKKPGECSRPKRGSILSRNEGAMMLEQIMSDIFCQKTLNSFLAASRPPSAKPSASRTALKLPALVAVTPSKVRRSSSRRRSSTPQVKALWLPPPCRAKLIALWVAIGTPVSIPADFGCAVITPALKQGPYAKKLLSQQTSFLVYCEQMGDDLCVNSLYSGLWSRAYPSYV